MNAPPEKAFQTFYANLYPRSIIGSRGSVYESKQLADEMAGPGRLACVAFEVEIPTSEGERRCRAGSSVTNANRLGAL